MSVRPDQETGPVTGPAIVSDGSVAGPDQMTQAAFLNELEITVRDVVDRELAVAGTSTRSCPYFETAMARYRGKSPAEVEQVARRYAGIGAGGPRELVAGVAERGRLSARRWVTDGSVDDLATALGVTQTTAEATGAGSALQGFEGPGPHDPDPTWVRSRLGRGAPLWGPHRHAMENALGVDLGQVRVHRGGSDAALARRLGHVGFTVDHHVVVDDSSLGSDPLTTSAVMAHELAHTVQQREPGPAVGAQRTGELESRADRAVSEAASVLAGDATAGTAGRGVGRARGLQLQRCEDCGGGGSSSGSGSAAPTKAASTFREVQLAVRAAPDQTTRDTALNGGIAAARTRADRLRSTAGVSSGPVATRRAEIIAQTGVGSAGSTFRHLDENPFYGVSGDRVAQAYRAWAENPAASSPPWVLLAVWVKEGATHPQVANTVPASSAADARAIWRSNYYFLNMGTDHYVHYTPGTGDNAMDSPPGSGAAHDTAFRAAVAQQVTAGRLPRDVSGDIDAALTVAPAGSGTFTVTPSERFFVLSLMLIDAYWRENRAAVTGPTGPPGTNAADVDTLTYMRWNMGSSRFATFAARDMSGNRDPDGSTPSLATWAFHREVRSNEWGQPRANALRFQFAADVYRMAYEGWAGSP